MPSECGECLTALAWGLLKEKVRPLPGIGSPIQNSRLRSFCLAWNDAGFIWTSEPIVPGGEDGRRDAKR